MELTEKSDAVRTKQFEERYAVVRIEKDREAAAYWTGVRIASSVWDMMILS